MTDAGHWDEIYRRVQSEDLGWYQPTPSTLPLVLAHGASDDAVLDVGGGDSRLVDHLAVAGFGRVTVVDLSAEALARSERRVRSEHPHQSVEYRWIEADATTWRPDAPFDLWHDRAVFHFLVDQDDRDRYRAAADRLLSDRGRLVVSTFGPDGPAMCAGLPVRRYGIEELAAEFGPEFVLIDQADLGPGEADRAGTAGGDSRPYVAVVLARR